MFITGLSRPLMRPMITRSCITQVNSVPVPAMKPPKPASVQDTIAGLQTQVRTLAPKVQHCMSDWPGRSVMWHGYTSVSRKEHESIFLMGYFLRTQGWPIHIAHLSTTALGSDAGGIMTHLENVCLVCETTPEPHKNVAIDFRLPRFESRLARSPEEVFQRPIISTFDNKPDWQLPQPIFIGKQSLLSNYVDSTYSSGSASQLELRTSYGWLSATSGPIFCEASPLLTNLFGMLLYSMAEVPPTPLIEKYHQTIHKEPLFNFNTAFNRFRHRVQTVVSEIKTKD